MPTTGIKPEFKTKPKMKSLIVKRSVVLGGHKTSVSLEDAFWKSLKGIATSGKMIAGQKKSISLEEAVWRSLKEIATNRDVTLLDLLTNIASTEDQRNLSSAIRLFVLNFYREQLEFRHIQKVVQAVLRSPVQALH